MSNTRIEQKPGPWAITDPTWPMYETPIPNPVLTSDGFSGPEQSILDRMSDAALGGAPSRWQVNPAHALATVSNGLLILPPGVTSGGGLAVGVADVEVDATVTEIGTGAYVVIVARAAQAVPGNAQVGYRAEVRPTGATRLAHRHGTGGGDTQIAEGPIISAGDRLGVRCIGDQISLIVNGVPAVTVTHDGTATGGFASYSQAALTGAAAAYTIDDFRARAIDHPELLVN